MPPAPIVKINSPDTAFVFDEGEGERAGYFIVEEANKSLSVNSSSTLRYRTFCMERDA